MLVILDLKSAVVLSIEADHAERLCVSKFYCGKTSS